MCNCLKSWTICELFQIINDDTWLVNINVANAASRYLAVILNPSPLPVGNQHFEVYLS